MNKDDIKAELHIVVKKSSEVEVEFNADTIEMVFMLTMALHEIFKNIESELHEEDVKFFKQFITNRFIELSKLKNADDRIESIKTLFNGIDFMVNKFREDNDE